MEAHLAWLTAFFVTITSLVLLSCVIRLSSIVTEIRQELRELWAGKK